MEERRERESKGGREHTLQLRNRWKHESEREESGEESRGKIN